MLHVFKHTCMYSFLHLFSHLFCITFLYYTTDSTKPISSMMRSLGDSIRQRDQWCWTNICVWRSPCFMLAGNPCLLSKVGVSKVGNRCVQCWAGTSKLGCLRLILQMHLFGREMFQTDGVVRTVRHCTILILIQRRRPGRKTDKWVFGHSYKRFWFAFYVESLTQLGAFV